MANDFCKYLHMSAFVSCPDKWQNPLKSGECAWQTEPEIQTKKKHCVCNGRLEVRRRFSGVKLCVSFQIVF